MLSTVAIKPILIIKHR